MNENKSASRGFFSILSNLFLVVCLVVTIFALVGYAAGWVTFDHDRQRQKTIIELETGELKEAADGAVNKGKELVEQAGETLQELGEDDSEKDAPEENKTSSPGDQTKPPAAEE